MQTFIHLTANVKLAGTGLDGDWAWHLLHGVRYLQFFPQNNEAATSAVSYWESCDFHHHKLSSSTSCWATVRILSLLNAVLPNSRYRQMGTVQWNDNEKRVCFKAPVSMRDGNHSTMDTLIMTKSNCGFYVHSRLTAVQVCKCQCSKNSSDGLYIFLSVHLREMALRIHLPSH